MSLNRYVEPLPVQLDSYKYLKNEGAYLQVSEYLKLDTEKEESNKITFKIEKDNTLVKFLIESSEIIMTLKDTFSSMEL